MKWSGAFMTAACAMALIAGVNAGAVRAATAENPLLKAKALTCYIEKGASVMWEGRRVVVRTGKWSKEKRDSILRFESIDYKNKTAKLKGNEATDDVSLMATDEGTTFFEKTAAGGMTVSTVFAEHFRGDRDRFPFVHSRHLLIQGVPVPSQYYGYCEITY